MTRRQILVASAAAPLLNAAAKHFDLSVEGYIFQQYAGRSNKKLEDVIDEVIPMARKAGFQNIELNPGFFAAEIRDRVLALIRSQQLRMPSVYVGGAMHTREAADQTIATALDIGKLCAPFGCKGIVNNPDPKHADEPKTDAELAVQADSLNRMGHALAKSGFDLRVHHHTPQLENNAREWRHILRNTDPDVVHICVDVDWAYEGGFDPLPFLKEVGSRLREIHVRSAKNKVWLEDIEDSDIDYRAVASWLREQSLPVLVVVELAYRTNTVVTRSLEANLRISREYTERVFNSTG
jgi:inosose dehydratase